MKLPRTVRFDQSGSQASETGPEDGEWAVPGGSASADDSAETLTGKRRQAFANGFLGLASFGHATFVTVASADEAVRERLARQLAGHFVERYGAPSVEDALPVAYGEIDFAAGLCAEHAPGTLLAVTREMTGDGIREGFHRIASDEPGVEQPIWSLFDEQGRVA